LYCILIVADIDWGFDSENVVLLDDT